MKIFWSVLFMLPVIAACSAQPGPADATVDARTPPVPRTICDGSDNLRVMVAVVQEPSRFFEGHRVLFDNGSYILIDGHCRFWVKPSANLFEEVRSGVLDPSTLAEFVNDIKYDYWPELQGSYFSEAGIFDTPDIIFVDRETSIRCNGLCLHDRTPPDIVAMREAQTVWNARLWAASVGVTGDMRASVIKTSITPDVWSAAWHPVPWPASIPIENIAISEAEAWSLGFGEGILLTGADADALRALRREFLRGDHGDIPSVGNSALISNGDGILYYVNVRDTTPFEDDRGIISWLSR